MPIIVDDEQRRAHISDVASRIIGRAGLQGLTIRAIAREAGCSTSFVTDFFADKRSMLLQVLADTAGRAKRRIDAVLTADPADLEGCVHAYLPLDDERQRDWKVYFAFWDMAASDPAFAREQRRWQDIARTSFVTILARRRGRERTADDIHHASRLLSLIMGLSTQAAFDPDVWSPQNMESFMTREIEEIISSA